MKTSYTAVEVHQREIPIYVVKGKTVGVVGETTTRVRKDVRREMVTCVVRSCDGSYISIE